MGSRDARLLVETARQLRIQGDERSAEQLEAAARVRLVDDAMAELSSQASSSGPSQSSAEDAGEVTGEAVTDAARETPSPVELAVRSPRKARQPAPDAKRPNRTQ